MGFSYTAGMPSHSPECLSALPFCLRCCRGAFATKHLWVTPYAEDEMNPAGDYPLHPDPSQNKTIADWTAQVGAWGRLATGTLRGLGQGSGAVRVTGWPADVHGWQAVLVLGMTSCAAPHCWPTLQNRRVADADVVLWHTFGLTHVVRPEDFPVM